MRLIGLAILAVSVILAPLSAEPEQAKIPQIGYLAFNSLPALLGAFRKGLRGLGYVEGQNVGIEYRLAEGRQEKLAPLAAELVQLKVDVIVAPTPIELEAAKQATRTIPIVMVAVGDPVKLGLVRSFGKPGGNITGLSSLSQEIASKQVELLTEVIPSVSRLALLQNPDNASLTSEFKERPPGH